MKSRNYVHRVVPEVIVLCCNRLPQYGSVQDPLDRTEAYMRAVGDWMADDWQYTHP